MPYFKGSETEARHVAIADGDAAAFGQQAVDRSHHAGEQGGGGQQADRCSLGHGVSPFLGAEPFRFLICKSLCMPDASYNGVVCMAAFCSLHCSNVHSPARVNAEMLVTISSIILYRIKKTGL